MTFTVAKTALDVLRHAPSANDSAAAMSLRAPILLAPPPTVPSLAAQKFSSVVQAVKARPFEFALLALFSMVLHGTLIKLVTGPKEMLAEKAPVIPEMTIELARPLPQAAAPSEPVQPRSQPQLRKQVQPRALAQPQAVAAHAAPETAAASSITTPAVPSPAPAAPVAPVEEPLTEPSGKAGYLHNPEPAYPVQAQRQGWEGSVLLKVHVLASGRPDSVEVQKSSGRRILDQAAVTAVQGWSFVPAKRGQRPVDGWVTVPIEFKLGG